MLDRKMIAALGGWEGYRVQRIVWPSDGSRTVTIHLVPTARRMHCEQCGSRCRQVHETSLRRVRELPLMALQVTLVVPRRRVWCEQCGGPRLEKLSWLGRYQRVTNRLAEAVNQLLASSNILATARFFGLGWHTVKALDKAWLRQSKAHCPNAEVVYDLFHVVAKYGREVIDRVRVDQANQLRQDKPARRVIKSSRWLLLRNRRNLEHPQRVRLDELLQANQPLLTTYLMRDELKRLWFYRHPSWARKAWDHWLEQAQGSGIAALEHFAHKLKAYLHGILSRCRHRLNTSIVEGINNTLKVIKRRAYGYRDQEYFFLKIRAAFPGILR